ncbi:glycerate kinase [Paenibacillus sp. N4]|uniref:glycerate kinase family protein n=1 Tax=Paenibacillus vietnamensis TaxID=2590547 RepID=UPI001CD0C7C5|nr:glycerate kinase [Paenibacillus vietnamensis]MCA0756885.1 glycerate kinase [Paenibacillus vietnamensis]
MKIIVAPDSYKGCLNSYEAAEYMTQGILEACPQAEVLQIAVADGGEGTVQAIVRGAGGRLHEVQVRGPLGDPVTAEIGLLDDGRTAVIEAASASGLTLIPQDRLNPILTTTYGTGQLIKEALRLGCRKLIIGLGGSATNDGGVGMAQALGVRFPDKYGGEIGYGGGELEHIAAIDLEGLDPRIEGCECVIASDVTNPLCGDNGAAAVYGPQKGATPEMVAALDRGLLHLSRIISRDMGKDIAELPGAGAAGGLGGGLMAFLSARMERGIDLVLEAADFEKRVSEADLVLTGEGHTDLQTRYGKAAAGIARIAKRHKVPVICLSGGISPDASAMQALYGEGMDAVIGAVQRPMPLEEAMKQAPALIRHAAASIIRTLMLGARMKNQNEM